MTYQELISRSGNRMDCLQHYLEDDEARRHPVQTTSHLSDADLRLLLQAWVTPPAFPIRTITLGAPSATKYLLKWKRVGRRSPDCAEQCTASIA
jgi:hypothetical protein